MPLGWSVVCHMGELLWKKKKKKILIQKIMIKRRRRVIYRHIFCNNRRIFRWVITNGFFIREEEN